MSNDRTISDATNALAQDGVHLLNFWLLSPDEHEHARLMSDAMGLPSAARICDLGCGTGALAELMLQMRPDMNFTLVNTNALQLAKAPEQTTRVVADMAETGLAGAEFDAVVLAYAAGHGDVVQVLEEAHRLLKPGGVLAWHDIFAATTSLSDEVMTRLNYSPVPMFLALQWAEAIGFDVMKALPDDHARISEHINEVSDLLMRLDHGLFVLRKSDRPHRFRGRKVALQFSGGKDSLACLYALRPFLEHIVVYWTNTGDAIPETKAVVDSVREWLPRFVEIGADVMRWKQDNGMPSDVVTARSHSIGMAYGMGAMRLSNRFDCCTQNLMLPMHQRMLADGVEMVIRGTKLCDTGTVPSDGAFGEYEVYLPLRDWSHAEVFSFLEDMNVPLTSVYDEFEDSHISAPECLHCTAWWEDGKQRYLEKHHPHVLMEYRASLDAVRQELRRSLVVLDAQLID